MTKSLEEIIATGDLTQLSDAQKVQHYNNVCEAMDIDPRPHPLEYMPVDDPNGGRRLILYALKNCTDQLRTKRKINITKLTREITEDMITFTAEAKDKDGVTDISTGSVNTKGKKGADLANASMFAETKAKRRVTLSISGAGLLDETEIADLNAPTSLPAGMGVTAYQAPNVSTPSASDKAGKEVKLEAKPEPVKKSKKEEQPATVPAVTVNATPQLDLIVPAAAEVSDPKSSDPEFDMKKNIDKVYAEGAAALKRMGAKNAEPQQAELIPNESSVVAPATLSTTAVSAEAPSSVRSTTTTTPADPVALTPVPELSLSETKDALSKRITVYKRDVLPSGGMRPSKGYGINAKLIKFFLVQFPDRKTINEFTNEELTIVLAKLDKVRDIMGEAAVVSMIDGEIGTK